MLPTWQVSATDGPQHIMEVAGASPHALHEQLGLGPREAELMGDGRSFQSSLPDLVLPSPLPAVTSHRYSHSHRRPPSNNVTQPCHPASTTATTRLHLTAASKHRGPSVWSSAMPKTHHDTTASVTGAATSSCCRPPVAGVCRIPVTVHLQGTQSSNHVVSWTVIQALVQVQHSISAGQSARSTNASAM